MDKHVIISVVVIAVMALLVRIIINKQQITKINWQKIALIFSALVIYFAVFLSVDLYKMKIYFKGEATLEDSKTEDITGLKPAQASRIIELTSAREVAGQFYYIPKPAKLESTGYYLIKNHSVIYSSVDREVKTSENSSQIISRKTNLFEVTRTPGDNIDNYIPIYSAVFADSTRMLIAVLPCYADVDNLPIGRIQQITGKLEEVAGETNDNEFYITTFNLSLYDSNYFNVILIRSAIALAVVIIFVSAFYGIRTIIRRNKNKK
ncbi:MAG: hypothetical protein IKR17_06665 [Bacteroidales bacterium]|nr:hypothetical protein [Bacteroidales bacterium]